MRASAIAVLLLVLAAGCRTAADAVLSAVSSSSTALCPAAAATSAGDLL
jgi:hypothetical protein